MRSVKFPAKSLILKRGVLSHEFFIIHKGEVSARFEYKGKVFSHTGREGEFFNLPASVIQVPCFDDIHALTECEILYLTLSEFFNLFWKERIKTQEGLTRIIHFFLQVLIRNRIVLVEESDIKGKEDGKNDFEQDHLNLMDFFYRQENWRSLFFVVKNYETLFDTVPPSKYLDKFSSSTTEKYPPPQFDFSSVENREHTYQAGEILFLFGVQPPLSYIERGSVDVLNYDQESDSLIRREILAEGEILATSSVLDKKPLDSFLVALEETTISAISPTDEGDLSPESVYTFWLKIIKGTSRSLIKSLCYQNMLSCPILSLKYLLFFRLYFTFYKIDSVDEKGIGKIPQDFIDQLSQANTYNQEFPKAKEELKSLPFFDFHERGVDIFVPALDSFTQPYWDDLIQFKSINTKNFNLSTVEIFSDGKEFQLPEVRLKRFSAGKLISVEDTLTERLGLFRKGKGVAKFIFRDVEYSFPIGEGDFFNLEPSILGVPTIDSIFSLTECEIFFVTIENLWAYFWARQINKKEGLLQAYSYFLKLAEPKREIIYADILKPTIPEESVLIHDILTGFFYDCEDWHNLNFVLAHYQSEVSPTLPPSYLQYVDAIKDQEATPKEVEVHFDFSEVRKINYEKGELISLHGMGFPIGLIEKGSVGIAHISTKNLEIKFLEILGKYDLLMQVSLYLERETNLIFFALKPCEIVFLPKNRGEDFLQEREKNFPMTLIKSLARSHLRAFMLNNIQRGHSPEIRILLLLRHLVYFNNGSTPDDHGIVRVDLFLFLQVLFPLQTGVMLERKSFQTLLSLRRMSFIHLTQEEIEINFQGLVNRTNRWWKLILHNQKINE